MSLISSRLLFVGLSASLTFLTLLASISEAETPRKFWVFVGTYTGGAGNSKGIYRFDFDATRGQLSHRALAAETKNPSFLAIHPNRRSLYAVGELDSFQGKNSGAISAFAIDPKTGDLKLLNQKPSGGAGPGSSR